MHHQRKLSIGSSTTIPEEGVEFAGSIQKTGPAAEARDAVERRIRYEIVAFFIRYARQNRQTDGVTDASFC